MARVRQNSKMAKLDPKGSRHGPSNKHVVTGGKRTQHPKGQVSSRTHGPLRGPKV